MTTTSFEKAVIIPLSTYERCVLTDKDTSLDILTDKSIPVDRKLKLFHHYLTSAAASSSSSASAGPPPPPPLSTKGQHIVHNFADVDKPVIKSILEVIHSNPSVIDYNDRLEVLVNGELFPESNLINILLYFTGNLPVTSDDDIPIASRDVYQALLGLSVPPVWIKARFKQRKQPKRKATQFKDTRPAKAGKWDSY